MPNTVEGYQAMQLEAVHLEYGGLLQQISIVGTQHQDIRITIASGTIPLHIVEQENDGWPSPPCCRLVNETEIIVLPPPLPPNQTPDGLKYIPCRQDMIDNDEMKRLAMELFEDWEKRWVDLPQKTVAVHPSIGMENCVVILRNENCRAFVRVVTSSVVPVGTIGTSECGC